MGGGGGWGSWRLERCRVLHHARATRGLPGSPATAGEGGGEGVAPAGAGDGLAARPTAPGRDAAAAAAVGGAGGRVVPLPPWGRARRRRRRHREACGSGRRCAAGGRPTPPPPLADMGWAVRPPWQRRVLCAGARRARPHPNKKRLKHVCGDRSEAPHPRWGPPARQARPTPVAACSARACQVLAVRPPGAGRAPSPSPPPSTAMVQVPGLGHRPPAPFHSAHPWLPMVHCRRQSRPAPCHGRQAWAKPWPARIFGGLVWARLGRVCVCGARRCGERPVGGKRGRRG